MTEKVAKKVGEAYAFAQVLSETFKNNSEVMSELLGEHAENIEDITRVQMEELKDIAEESDMDEVVLEHDLLVGVGDGDGGDAPDVWHHTLR
mgnify:CR=1 FL=1